MSSVMPLGAITTSVPPARMKHRPPITNSRSRLLRSLVGGRYTICSMSDRSAHPIVPDCQMRQPVSDMAGLAIARASTTAAARLWCFLRGQLIVAGHGRADEAQDEGKG